MRIEVTEEDIRCGLAKDCERCPVALAIKRAALAERAIGAWVDDDTMGFVTEAGSDYATASTKQVRDFFRDFDRGRSVTPFAFEANFKAGYKLGDDEDGE